MRTNFILRSGAAMGAVILSLASEPFGLGQGTFQYDQQSADESTGGGGAVGIQANHPVGQSFMPSLSSVGFIRLFLSDNSFNGLGATVYVNLRQDSITGSIVGTSDLVSMPDRFSGYTDFSFATAVAVIPEASYVLQPVVQSGDSWSVRAYSYGYLRGTSIQQGLPYTPADLWFREGIVVPEPGTWALLLVGFAALAWRRRLFR